MAGAPGWPIRAAAVLAALLPFVSGCGLIGGGLTRADVPDTITVTSPDFGQGLTGTAFSCRGPGRHPVLHWSGTPRAAKSLALVMDDSAAPITPFIYWIVFNIGPQSSDIPAGHLPRGAQQADNSKGTFGYDPPCPANRAHAYRFTVYALGSKLNLGPQPTAKTAWEAIARYAIARGRLTATIAP
jgi:Raf kinase inhibitor-like YbhB/YbcL family protein